MGQEKEKKELTKGQKLMLKIGFKLFYVALVFLFSLARPPEWAAIMFVLIWFTSGNSRHKCKCKCRRLSIVPAAITETVA